MSLRGAKRRGNPYSLRQCKTRSNTLGEYGKVHTNLPEVVPSYQASLRGRGLPQVCALVRNDMLKTDTHLRLQDRLARRVRGNLGRVSGARHWFAMTCRNMRRECVCKNVGRNDIHKPGGQAHRRAKESLDKAPAPVVQWRQLNITKNGKSKAGIVHREPGHWLEARRREAPQVRPGVKGAAPLAASRP